MGFTNFSGSGDDGSGNGPLGTGGGGNGGNGGNPNIVNIGGGQGQSSGDDLLDMANDLMINYNKKFAKAAPVLFRDDQIYQASSILMGKNKPNPLLLGSAGVGKTAITEELARRIEIKHDSIHTNLHDHTIWELPIANLVAGAGHRGALETAVQQLIEFASKPKYKAIIFIDEIHQLTSDRTQTYEKIAQMLKPALARGEMRLIGSTTLQEAKGFDDDPALKRRFSNVLVDELSKEQATEILKVAAPYYMAHYKSATLVDPTMLGDVVDIADEFNRAGNHRPDNALTLLDRAMADSALERHTMIASMVINNPQVAASMKQTPNLLTKAVVRRTAQRLMTGHNVKPALNVNKLNADLSRIKGQDAIINDLVDAIERNSLDLTPQTTPHVWMFAGASGVGKTEVARIIATSTTHEPPIILNMTEFMHGSSVNRIIGSPRGYLGSDSNQPLPFDVLETNPNRVILLDEFEKADKAVQRLFLSVFDTGLMETALGKTIDFTKTTIIVTTNAARDQISKPSVGFGTPDQISAQNLTKALEQYFDAELLGRFTSIIAFDKIQLNTYREILQDVYIREVADLKVRHGRSVNMLDDALPDDVLDKLSIDTFLSNQGARPANQAARKYIEDTVLNARRANAARLAALATPTNAAPATSTEDGEGGVEGETIEEITTEDPTSDITSDDVGSND